MGQKHKPRSGSLAFYPRVRARKETPSWRTFPTIESESVKPLNFLGYKVGMVHGLATDENKKTVSAGQKIQVPMTIIEVPPVHVYGIRAYKKQAYGPKALMDVLSEKQSKFIKRKIKTFKTKKSKKQKETKSNSFEDVEKLKEKISFLRLLVETQPSKTKFGKKTPDLIEMALTGTVEEQLTFAKEKIGKEIRASEVFEEKQFIDTKSVTIGHGFQGVVKRAGVKIHRPKAKKHRIVGSISPWSPATVMWTVARPGQHGYHNRTEYNKRILKISEDTTLVNLPAGYPRYGVISNEYFLIAGSIGGPVKRAIALRQPIRPTPEKKWNVGDLTIIKPSVKLEKLVKGKTEKKKVAKVEVKKEVKKEEVKEKPKTETKKEETKIEEKPKEVKQEA